MTRVDISYFNHEHGGREMAVRGGWGGGYALSGLAGAGYHGGGHGLDFSGLVQVMADEETPWPDIFIMGEGDKYEYDGEEGTREAARAMRQAGGPGYEPLICSLPREGGPFAPVIFVNPATIEVRRWYSHRAPDFADRNRNLLIAGIPGRGDEDIMRIVARHGDMHDPDLRLADSRKLRRFAEPGIPCLVAEDSNGTPSGPMYEDCQLNDPRYWPPGRQWARAHRAEWRHGPGQAGPYAADTRALDYLVGWWNPDKQCREGGIGFYDVAELEQNPTPTQVPTPDGRLRRILDRFLVNTALKDKIIPGSYRVHEPVDPDNPDSDHKRISMAVDL